MTKIYSKDRVFQLAYKNGWVGLKGTQITIQGIDFALCPLKEHGKLIINISEVSSGALLFGIPVPNLKRHILNTRENAIEYYKVELVPIIESVIKENGIEKVKEEIAEEKKRMINIFGDRPLIADVELSE
ncbi:MULTISPECIES: hypothetical protein [Listeria]|uniref:Uncharacterized protein n=2 Tax=Listeria TaxID=1637 RepID=A0A7X0X9M9_9LIST|nr:MULTISPECIES: hypothetical protein [Listeria]MBC1481581.1 hypothetical protein [Listeria seeligeri]MBC1490109.1 hypothetical protein [Listeria immobilis]QPL19466.1 hypothetical protein pLIS600156c [Listeria ivanovii]UCK61598.1 hypothetical protein pLIS46_00141c [Listeria ivanovii]